MVEKLVSSQRVVVLNGPAGVGKTTVGRLLVGRAANGVCIDGDSLAHFIVSRVPGAVEQGLGYANGALLAGSYVRAGYDLVVFEYCFEHPRHIRRFLDAYDGVAPVSVFTLWGAARHCPGTGACSNGPTAAWSTRRGVLPADRGEPRRARSDDRDRWDARRGRRADRPNLRSRANGYIAAVGG